MPRDAYETVKEVAERMKVNEATVRKWIRDGDLTAVDIGKGWRVADCDFGAFLMIHATRPRAEEDASAAGSATDDRA